MSENLGSLRYFTDYLTVCVFEGDVRNDIYVTLCEGEFNRGSKTADKNVEVTMLVCNKKGEVIPVSKLGPRFEKTSLQGFRPDPTQTGLYSHRRWLEA